MLAVGEQFPDFAVTATVSTNKDNAFKTITNEDYKGKWKIFFFWPKDFTFVCPTEIAAFGKLNKEFQDRDAQILRVDHNVSESDHLFVRLQRATRLIASNSGTGAPLLNDTTNLTYNIYPSQPRRGEQLDRRRQNLPGPRRPDPARGS